MHPVARLFVASLLTVTVGIAVVFTATQNYLPKYAADGTLVDSAVYESSGNVGIGTASPAYKLDVNGAVHVNADAHVDHALRVYGGTYGGVTVGQDYYSTVSPNNGMIVQGNVGIGTTSPGARLDVNGSVRAYASSSAGLFQAYGGGLDGSTLQQFVLYADTSNGLYFDAPKDSNGNKLDVQFNWRGGGTPPLLIKGATGNVGVGTASPAAKLHVAGNVTVDGNIAAKYQDVAEWVRAREPLAAGTVVAISEDARDGVEGSRRGYDTSVAGVVSPQPGITLGEKADGKVLVAHSGRVRVKIDATYGAVKAGDLLVTSPTAGYAMRSEPIDMGGSKIHRPGTLLGKALEPLQSGRGEILVLLTLQ